MSSYPEGLQADVLLAPHHGSMTSSSAGFIAATAPSEVVYTTGFRNRFGFPRPEVTRRYSKAGVIQWNTAETGMLRYHFTRDPGQFRRIIYRDSRRRLWRPPTEHATAK